MHAREMIATHTDVQGNTADRLIALIEEAYSCAQACTACADACLAESMVEQLRECIRLNLDCADMCAAAGAMASRRTGRNVEVLRAAIQACEVACRRCGQECERHASEHEHCRICADPASGASTRARAPSKRSTERSRAGETLPALASIPVLIDWRLYTLQTEVNDA